MTKTSHRTYKLPQADVGVYRSYAERLRELWIQDYSDGKMSKEDLIAELRLSHLGDMLAVTEELEELDQIKDKILQSKGSKLS